MFSYLGGMAFWKFCDLFLLFGGGVNLSGSSGICPNFSGAFF